MEDGEISPSPSAASLPLPASEKNTPLTAQLIQIAQELDVEIHPTEEMELDESPYPPHLRQLDKVLTPDRRADSPGHIKHADGRYSCRVNACEGITFCRYDAFTRHWAQVHRRKILHVCCPDPNCGYSSSRADDVKKHTTAVHHNLSKTKFQRKFSMNPKFVDPGIYDSPKKVNSENREPKKKNIEVKIVMGGKRKINEISPKPQNNMQPIQPLIQPPVKYVPEETDEASLRNRLLKIQKQKHDILKEEDMVRAKIASLSSANWQQKYERVSKALEEERLLRRKAEEKVSELEKIAKPEVMALLAILQKK